MNKTDWNNELSSWSDEDFIRIFHKRPDLANRLRKMLAEPVAWMQRSYLNQIRESNVALHNVVIRGSKLDGDGDVVPLYAHPQPSEPEHSGWYCAHCQRGVDSSEVTFHEQHLECGRVITDDSPPQPAEPVSRDVEALVRLLEDGEWAEHVARTPLGQRLELAITALVGEASKPHNEPVKVPSDSAIMFEWSQTPNTGDMRVDLIAFARALLARYGQPAQPTINWPAVTEAIKEYVADYEMIGEADAAYDPTDDERYMLTDAIHGLLADDGFMALLRGAGHVTGEVGSEPVGEIRADDQPDGEPVKVDAEIV